MKVKWQILCLMLITKVIIHKSRGEVFLVEQDTIECVSSAYLKYIHCITFYYA